MERIRFVTHKGARVLLLDYSEMSDTQEILQMIGKVREFIPRHPLGSLLVLNNVRNAVSNSTIVQATKESALHNRPYERAAAVIGLSGMQRLILRTVQTFSGRNDLYEFRDETAALDWLAEQAGITPPEARTPAPA